MSTASIDRQAIPLAERLGESPPIDSTVCAVIRDLDPGLVTLVREVAKAYLKVFDLVHRHEATAPNAVWRDDHTELDIWLKDVFCGKQSGGRAERAGSSAASFGGPATPDDQPGECFPWEAPAPKKATSPAP